MDILIIGNGFDLAHGLKTSYKDFLEFCCKNSLDDYTKDISSINEIRTTNLWFKHFVTKQQTMGNNWINLEEEIENVIRCIGSIKFDKPRIIHSLNEKNIDFDLTKISSYLKNPDEASMTFDIQVMEELYNEDHIRRKGYTVAFDTNYRGKFHVLLTNSKALTNFLYDQLRQFTQAFEEYLVKWVLPEIKQTEYNLSFENGYNKRGVSDLYILSFNYTNTCEQLYGEKYGVRGFNIKSAIYVHGKIGNNTACNLILGTNSFNNDKHEHSTNDIDSNYNIFQKHNQRHKYGTIESYQEFMRFLIHTRESNIPTFHIIGHSLDKADHNILKHILLASEYSIINIYYHNEETQDLLIRNITEIISEKEVMARVRLIYQHDKNRGILKHRSAALCI